MRRMPQYLALLFLFAALQVDFGRATGADERRDGCARCHPAVVDMLSHSMHASIACEKCHEGAAECGKDGKVAQVHFDMESCASCHPDQYRTFLKDVPMKTFYKGSSDVPDDWPVTIHFPFWESLIDGNVFVMDTHENRAMKYNQIDAQSTKRPSGESCLTCHGTKVAYYMGMSGIPGYPARFRTIKQGRQVSSGNMRLWQNPPVESIEIPSGTQVAVLVDNTDSNSPSQVKSVVLLPDGRIYSSYEYPGATATGDSDDPVKQTEARNYIWAALEALAFDGLDPVINKPSMDAGLLCNMCHDPHSGGLRIIQKALIWAIGRKGINPYSASGSQVRNLREASRQDRIIAVCAQCHSEYVGGYSSIDRVNRHFFPWGKPDEVEAEYRLLFQYNQDFKHGEGVRPWQTEDPGRDGYFPAGSLFPIHQPLIKSQHPEAEVFWNSRMYLAGATCTDCHSIDIARPNGTVYTNHWFASPIKYIRAEGVAPCARCHSGHHMGCGMRGGMNRGMGVMGRAMMSHHGAPPMSNQELLVNIKNIQDWFFYEQEKTQAALVNSLKYISTGESVPPQAIENHQKAHFRWEYYAQAENSMGFHNRDEAIPAMQVSAKLAASLVPWPMPPIRLGIAAGTPASVTLTWQHDGAGLEGFVIERRDDPGAEYRAIARVPALPGPSGSYSVWSWTDAEPEGAFLTYRVAAYNAAGTSAYTQPVSTVPGRGK